MKTIKLEFDAAKMTVDGIKIEQTTHIWMNVEAEMDERDLSAVLENIGIAKIVDALGVEALLNEIGEKDCIEYFELELKED